MRNIKWSVSVVCRCLSTKGLFFFWQLISKPEMKAGLSVLCSWSPFEISRGDLLSASYQRIIFSIRGFFFSCQRFHQKHRDYICVCVCEATGVRPQSVASGICSDTAATKQSRVRVGFQKNKTKPKPFFL